MEPTGRGIVTIFGLLLSLIGCLAKAVFIVVRLMLVRRQRKLLEEELDSEATQSTRARVAVGTRGVQGYSSETVPRYNDLEFKSHFRMNRTCFQFVEHKFGSFLARGEDAHTSVSPRDKLLLTLWTLANNESLRGVGDRFGMTKGNAHGIYFQTVMVLAGGKDAFIVWPSKSAQAVEAAAGNTAGIPGCVGYVDGCHIPIKKPHFRGDEYINRKGHASLLLQGICDSQMRFTNIVTGWPGSVHDYRVYKESKIGKTILSCPNFLFADETYHLLGDSAYSNSQGLLAPFKDNGHLEHRHRRFNKKHSSQRVKIENCFARLKQKFRRLKDFLDMSNMEMMINVIVAACVLHNIIIMHGCEDGGDDNEAGAGGDTEESEYPQETSSVNSVANRLQLIGNKKREEIMNSLMV